MKRATAKDVGFLHFRAGKLAAVTCLVAGSSAENARQNVADILIANPSWLEKFRGGRNVYEVEITINKMRRVKT